MYDNRKFFKGEDIRFFVTIRNNDGVLENIEDDYEDLILYFYNAADPHKSIIRASKREKMGFIPIVKAYNTSQGKYMYECVIDSNITEHMPAGLYFVETNVSKNKATEFTDQNITISINSSSSNVITVSDNSMTGSISINSSNGVYDSSMTDLEYNGTFNINLNETKGIFEGTLTPDNTEETFKSGVVYGKYLQNGETIEFDGCGKYTTQTTAASSTDDDYDRSGKKIFKFKGVVTITVDETTGKKTETITSLTGTLKTGVEEHTMNNIGKAAAFTLENDLIKRTSDFDHFEAIPEFPMHDYRPIEYDYGTYLDRTYRRQYPFYVGDNIYYNY